MAAQTSCLMSFSPIADPPPPPPPSFPLLSLFLQRGYILLDAIQKSDASQSWVWHAPAMHTFNLHCTHNTALETRALSVYVLNQVSEWEEITVVGQAMNLDWGAPI